MSELCDYLPLFDLAFLCRQKILQTNNFVNQTSRNMAYTYDMDENLAYTYDMDENMAYTYDMVENLAYTYDRDGVVKALEFKVGICLNQMRATNMLKFLKWVKRFE